MHFFTKSSFIAFTLLTLVSSFSFGATQLPKLILKSIINETGHDIVLTDTLTKKTMAIAAGATAQLNLPATDKNVVISGNMREIMARAAQYLIKKADATDNNQEVYMHMNLAQGGIDDGSGMITGKLGTIIFKFLLAGKNGGCQMGSQTLTNTQNSVAVSLKLSVLKRAQEENRFAINADYSLEEK